MQHSTAALRVHAPGPDAPDPMATWSAAMPTAVLAHPALTPGARLLAAHLWALAGWQPGALVRTTLAALADALAMPASTLRDHIALLQRAGYLAVLSVRGGRPECAGGIEITIHGPAALAEPLRQHRPPNTPQRDLPLVDDDDVRAACQQLARELDGALAVGGRPHTVQRWLLVAAALMAHGVPLRARRRDANGHIRVTLSAHDVLGAARIAARRRDVGAAWYGLVRDRMSAAAGVPVRWPAPEIVRDAAASIGWAWRATWHHSPRDLRAEWQAARDAGDDREYAAWLAAKDADT